MLIYRRSYGKDRHSLDARIFSRMFTFAFKRTRTVALSWVFQNLPLEIYSRFGLNLFNLKFISQSQVALILNKVKIFTYQIADYQIQTKFINHIKIFSLEIENTSENGTLIFATTTWKLFETSIYHHFAYRLSDLGIEYHTCGLLLNKSITYS